MFDNPLFWEHGVFLQPQHFQLERLQLEKNLARTLRTLFPWSWGISHLVINEDILGNDAFEISEMELLLPSSEWILFPGNATIPAKSFRDIWKNPEEPLPVYLGLSNFGEQGANVIRSDDPANVSETFRFTAPSNPEKIIDLYGEGPTSEVYTMRYNLRLCFGTEEGRDLWKFPIARLLRDGEHIYLDQHISPPCIDLNAIPCLQQLVRDIRDTVFSRCRQLEEYKIITGKTGEITGVSSFQGITFFSMLGALSRIIPDIEFVLSAPTVHPCQIYRVFCRLIGELSVFSSSLSPLGETAEGVRSLKEYNHINPYESLSSAANIISRLVDTLVIGPAFTFTLETDPSSGMMKTVMSQNALNNNDTYWLLLRSENPVNLVDLVHRIGKLAPTSDMPGIISQALPGIRLMYKDQPPAGLPRRRDTVYFKIDQNDPLWKKILQHGQVSFSLAERPSDLRAQITVIQS